MSGEEEVNGKESETNEEAVAPSLAVEYSAFEKWPYRQILYPTDQEQSWRDMGNSYFGACRPLIAALANGELREDIEGSAAIFLFRHYLELMLKRILFSGRILASGDELVAVEDIAEVSKTHDLATIWDWVIKDAKPKLPEWDNYDVASVKQCVMEFHKADRGGVAFRYDREGGELYRFDFAALNDQMDHIRQVLEGIWTGLSEMAHAIREYEAELQSEYGSDLYW